MKLVILLPAYNEASVLGPVLSAMPVKLKGVDSISVVVVDDGSRDETAQVAEQNGALVVRHRMNRGVGVATKTGLAQAKKLHADIVVTMDSDGQHDPKDIVAVIKPLLANTADVVIGTRLIDTKNMPRVKVLGNKIMNSVTRVFGGVRTTDSQSGFRAYNRTALQNIHLSSRGYEVCSEILGSVKRARLRLVEVPITTIYTSYSKKKGQTVTNALNIIIRLTVRSITR